MTLFPPENADNIDEESGDENKADIDHLPGRILRSEVEVTFAAKPNDDEDFDFW